MPRLTNKDLQAKCDMLKYERGFLNGCDNSGMMEWCNHCYYQKKAVCGCLKTHDERQANCLCARAYRRMEKDESEK